MAALLFAGLVGASTTIQTVVNNDHHACRLFLNMVKAAGIPNMTDAQLCNFRFAQLPPSKSKGFTFPQWKPMTIADPAAMYFHMRIANVVPRWPANKTTWPSYMKAVREAAHDNNLAFYTTQLQLEGKGPPVTFAQMDIKRCSKQPYMKELGAPFYAIFDDPTLQHPEPVAWESDYAQVALWEKRIPIQLSVSSLGVVVRDDAKPVPTRLIQITLNGLVRSSADGPFHGAIHDYGVCAFNIRKTLPARETKP